MALIGKTIKREKENGEKEEVFVVEFSNGTFTQLKELQKFFESEGMIRFEGPEDVVRLGISWLEKIKEDKIKNKK